MTFLPCFLHVRYVVVCISVQANGALDIVLLAVKNNPKNEDIVVAVLLAMAQLCELSVCVRIFKSTMTSKIQLS